MQTSYHPYQVVLLSSSFKNPERRLFFTRARLFPDRIELSGWHLGKKYRRCIPLSRLDTVEWLSDADDSPNVVFHLREGESIRVTLSEVDRWKHVLEYRMRHHTPLRLPLPSTNSTSWSDLPLHEIVTYTTSLG